MIKFKVLQERVASLYPPIFKYMAAEARKCKTWEEYKYEYEKQKKTGIYYHLTKEPNFKIDSERGAKDWSDPFGDVIEDVPGTMYVTGDPACWSATFSDPQTDEPLRKYVALLDLSAVPMQDYKRSIIADCNEYVVHNSKNIKLIKLMNLKQALKFNEKYEDALVQLIQDENDLKKFYDFAMSHPEF